MILEKWFLINDFQSPLCRSTGSWPRYNETLITLITWVVGSVIRSWTLSLQRTFSCFSYVRFVVVSAVSDLLPQLLLLLFVSTSFKVKCLKYKRFGAEDRNPLPPALSPHLWNSRLTAAATYYPKRVSPSRSLYCEHWRHEDEISWAGGW